MFNLSEEQEKRARRLHKESLVADSLAGATGMIPALLHTPSMLKKLDHVFEKVPPVEGLVATERAFLDELRAGKSDVAQEWMESSGVDVFHITVLTPGAERFEDAVTGIALWQRRIDSCEYLVKVTSFKDIERARTQGKRAIIMGFQDSECLGRDWNKLQIVYDLGVRIIQLTYNKANFTGSGMGEPKGGLTRFGSELVKRMNQLGILVDLSHCGYQTTLDAIEFSGAPVAVTHGCRRMPHDTVRGKTDEELKALATNNGYLGVAAVPPALTDLSKREASINDFLDHLDHVAGIMGVDKVGIGSDWPGPEPDHRIHGSMKLLEGSGFPAAAITDLSRDLGAVVQGFEDYRAWPNFTRGLVSRGYNDDEIEGFIGANFLRIFRDVVG